MSNPFVPTWLDDASLTPVQFRILAHLWRRADRSGECWPSAPTIAATCKINRDSVWPAIAILEARGFLDREKAFRNSNRYRLRVGGKQGPTQEIESAEKEGRHPAESEGLHPAEKEGRQSAEKEGRKGTPKKELHLRNSKEGEKASPFPDEVLLWNSFSSLPKVAAMNSSRTKSLAARRAEPFWQENWSEGVKKLAASSFATGTNDRGWKADFDFLLQPASLTKIIEGKYDDRRSTAAGGRLDMNGSPRTRHNNSMNEPTDLPETSAEEMAAAYEKANGKPYVQSTGYQERKDF